MKDKIGDDLRTRNSAWNFKGSVAKNFQSHISKSIPIYSKGQELVTQVSDFFIKKDSICYELGCSTGALTNLLAKRHVLKKQAKFVGIDIEKDMIRQANKKKSNSNIKFVCDDVMKYKLKKSDLIISYYTTQFINPSDRQIFFKKIFSSLKWGGAFILFEKVRARDARFQDMTTGLYNEFKLDNGYSPTEIFNKTRSLKGVMEPFSDFGNTGLIKRAGFKDMIPIFQWLCFKGYLCIK